MAIVKENNGELLLSLSTIEVAGAFHQPPVSKLSNLVRVTRASNPWTTSVLRGIRAPGTGIPFVIMLGTLRYHGGKDFCVVYGRKPVVILEFENEEFNRWIVSERVSLPESVQAKIGN